MYCDWKDHLYVLGALIGAPILVGGAVWIIAHIPILREILFGAAWMMSALLGIVSMGTISQ